MVKRIYIDENQSTPAQKAAQIPLQNRFSPNPTSSAWLATVSTIQHTTKNTAHLYFHKSLAYRLILSFIAKTPFFLLLYHFLPGTINIVLYLSLIPGLFIFISSGKWL